MLWKLMFTHCLYICRYALRCEFLSANWSQEDGLVQTTFILLPYYNVNDDVITKRLSWCFSNISMCTISWQKFIALKPIVRSTNTRSALTADRVCRYALSWNCLSAKSKSRGWACKKTLNNRLLQHYDVNDNVILGNNKKETRDVLAIFPCAKFIYNFLLLYSQVSEVRIHVQSIFERVILCMANCCHLACIETPPVLWS